MIAVEPMAVPPTAVLTRGNFRVADDAVSPGFGRIVDDRVAPRLAVTAIYEGRALALRL